MSLDELDLYSTTASIYRGLDSTSSQEAFVMHSIPENPISIRKTVDLEVTTNIIVRLWIFIWLGERVILSFFSFSSIFILCERGKYSQYDSPRGSLGKRKVVRRRVYRVAGKSVWMVIITPNLSNLLRLEL